MERFIDIYVGILRLFTERVRNLIISMTLEYVNTLVMQEVICPCVPGQFPLGQVENPILVIAVYLLHSLQIVMETECDGLCRTLVGNFMLHD